MAYEVACCPQDQGIRIEILQGVITAEPPREQNGIGHLVELDAAPVGLPVNPEILPEASMLVLTDA